jgi:ABC-type bacteriocin/lantibiotic exporter with double-glycine peptidase domain
VSKPLPLEKFAWPADRVGELLENLARKAKLISRPPRLPAPPDGLLHGADDESLSQWLDNAAGSLGIEAEPISVQYLDLDRLLTSGGPVILRLPETSSPDQPAYVALLSAGSRRLRLVCPDLRVRRVPEDWLHNLLSAHLEVGLGELIDDVLRDAEVPPERFHRARQAILRDQLGPLRIEAGWILRQSPGAGLPSQFRDNKLFRPVWILITMYLIQQLLTIVSWYIIGRGIFQGHFEMSWIFAWAILLLMTIPVQVIVSSAQSELSMSAGAIFKQRLLQGTLKLSPEEIRHQGLGQFLGRVMESEAVEMLALSGGMISVLSIIDLGLAVIILSRAAGYQIIAWSLVGWIGLTLWLLWRYYRNSLEWANTYRSMTNDLVESMVGHRTRLIQEDPSHWHDEEDQTLERYLGLSEGLDVIGMQINAVVSRGWIIVGLTGLAIGFVTQSSPPNEMAIGLGGILLAAQGLGKLAGGSQSLASLLIAWQQVGPLFNAAGRPRDLPDLSFVPPARQGQPSSTMNPDPDAARPALTQIGTEQPLLLARDMVFRYRSQGKPVLQDCSLQIYPGDRVLLEGPSGGGKTTLGAVLTGLRVPESGSLLLWGYDRKILGGEEWRRRVVMAPQFQENHVFSETFAFNLLMGRRWPPSTQDLELAEQICAELGLGEVLQRMPSGFQQMLGESGWQLSHGERSRLFIARALLQQADLIILDESFGALDPENLSRAIRCVLDRAASVVVIAHP